MISRTAYNQLGHSAPMLVGTVIGLVLTYVVPLALLFSGHAVTIALGAAAWMIMTLAYAPMTRFYGLGLWWALALPASSVFYMGATLHSAFSYWSNRGGAWKGRLQDRAKSSATQ
jgi:hypothetical protein